MNVTSILARTAVAAAIAVASLGAQAQTSNPVNLNSNGVEQTFSYLAGTYQVSFLSAFYSAYSLRITGSGAPQGSYRTISSVTADGITTPLGSYNEFSSATAAVDHANTFSYFFTTSGAPVTFRVTDDQYWDNSGGVSLAITAVPEPGTYAMMLAGLAVTGFVARRRRRDA